ncbi:MAG: tRNA lysidine(34) synthetase TilS [Prosthecobacter sp.]|jgi:tRNA(Ile)-lysidine synthase|uniref:tRNA lysidine(34) synthetase TilS n=1 Tax=Prosthecobacter sp. TaxID=1965333 RepID=UPI0019DFE839|nr:tRNA lysidine(34) synthetase TilS [Prosthecobacter sp.]MBE2285640.1 tRNA lysidine(34) synthetase TilS [Prosthecobacter sp.]
MSFPSLQLPSACDPAQPALLAISGGRDSVALLHLLLDAGFTDLILCHLNHGLRGEESDGDAAFVTRLAKKHGLKCEVETEDVTVLAKKRRISVETAAREARHAFLLRMAEKHDTWVVFAAHHAEDQAETILANLCRGSGLGGLAGMSAVQRLDSGLHFVRPLLHLRRSEIDAFLRSKRLKFREDSSNTSPQHRRNRLRHEVLPLLNDVFARDVSVLITRLGMLADRDEDCLQDQAVGHLSAPGRLREDRSLRIDPELLALHPAVLSRVLATWLREVCELGGIENDVIEAAMDMLAPGGPAKINLPHDKHLRRKAKRLWVA